MPNNNTVLCLDVGNSQMLGGVFVDDKISRCFRYDTTITSSTSDQLGIFLRSVLRENSIDPTKINKIAICSVVPHMDYSLRAACKKYFDLDPFMLQPGIKTGIKIKYANPTEVGADLIAEVVAACERYPKQNIIIVDFGTATTFCAVSKQKEFLGGLIMPGVRLCMEALQSNTAKLPTVKIIKPSKIVGNSTIESIQAGIYYGQLTAIKGITQRMAKELFVNDKPAIIGTGGFSHLFAEEGVFTEIIPNIVLYGLLAVLNKNENKKS